MSIEKQLADDMKAAMKAKDKHRLETIRMLRSELKNAQISKGEELAESDVLQVLSTAAKRRREAMEQYAGAGQQDRADEEKAELEIIATYLPAQLDEAAITQIVDDAIQQVGATSMKDMGALMGAVMPKLKGQADGKLVQQVVKKQLAALS